MRTDEPGPSGSESNGGLGVGVGSMVWVFDINRRRYTKPEPGRTCGSIIWREHWVPRKIVGETSRSWVLYGGTKVPKRGADPSLFAFSEAEIDRRAWVEDNAHKIERAVGRLRNYETLRRVAEVIGFETPTAEGNSAGACARPVSEANES